jgi:hypothetical protein
MRLARVQGKWKCVRAFCRGYTCSRLFLLSPSPRLHKGCNHQLFGRADQSRHPTTQSVYKIL